MIRGMQITFLQAAGHKVMPETDKMRDALKKGEVICPHGNSGWIKHLEYDTCDRDVLGVNEDGKIEVRSEFYCEGSGDFIFFSCTCEDCCALNAGGVVWFPESEVEYL
jgi:hypothetical protein